MHFIQVLAPILKASSSGAQDICTKLIQMKRILLSIMTMTCLGASAQMPGVVDSTFGKNGYGVLMPSVSQSEFSNQTVCADDKILSVGSVGGSNEDIYVAKWTKDGQPDSSFGVNGIILYDPKLGADDNGIDIVELPDGKIMVLGITTGAGGSDILLMRLNSDGTIDNSFSNNGIKVQAVLGKDYATKMKIVDNYIYVGGYYKSNNVTKDAFFLKFDFEGAVESSYGVGGIAHVNIGNDNMDMLQDFDVTNSGEVYAVGRTVSQSSVNQYLCKLDKDGWPDLDFAKDGFLIYSEAGFTRFNSVKYHKGDIYVCGGYELNNYDVAFLMKVDTTGFISNTFGGGSGKMVLNIGQKVDQQFNDIQILDDGSFLLAGSYRFDSGILHGLSAVADSTGVLYKKYETKGYKIAEEPAGYLLSYCISIVRQQNGKFVMSGPIADAANNIGLFVSRLSKEKATKLSSIVANHINVKVYPNPTRGTFYFDIDVKDIIKASVYDMSGKEVMTIHENNSFYQLPETLTNGLYYISVNTKTGTVVKQIMLSK